MEGARKESYEKQKTFASNEPKSMDLSLENKDGSHGITGDRSV